MQKGDYVVWDKKDYGEDLCIITEVRPDNKEFLYLINYVLPKKDKWGDRHECLDFSVAGDDLRPATLADWAVEIPEKYQNGGWFNLIYLIEDAQGWVYPCQTKGDMFPNIKYYDPISTN